MVSCPKSYGLSLSRAYSSYLHDKTDTYRDVFDGAWKAKDQMVWLIKKHDVIFSKQSYVNKAHFSRRFSLDDPRVFHTDFVEYTGDFEGNSSLHKLSSVPKGEYSDI
jgi:hypothetical protein